MHQQFRMRPQFVASPQQQQHLQMQRFRMHNHPVLTQGGASIIEQPVRPQLPPQHSGEMLHQQQMRPGMMGPGGMGQYGQPQQMLIGQQMRPQMAPPPPGITAPMTPPLRLSIPPQPPLSQPRTPTSATGSQQASPALTPRSDIGDNEFMDSSSSRGQTPAPGDGSFDHSGPTTPTAEGYFTNGEPPQKVIKRRPSAQQKRRQSAGGKDIGGPNAKKRARKGSKESWRPV